MEVISGNLGIHRFAYTICYTSPYLGLILIYTAEVNSSYNLPCRVQKSSLLGIYYVYIIITREPTAEQLFDKNSNSIMLLDKWGIKCSHKLKCRLLIVEGSEPGPTLTFRKTWFSSGSTMDSLRTSHKVFNHSSLYLATSNYRTFNYHEIYSFSQETLIEFF